MFFRIIITITGVFIMISTLVYIQLPRKIQFISAESKCEKNREIINEIEYNSKLKIWFMRQGYNSQSILNKKSDYLAISIEDEETKYFQLKPNAVIKDKQDLYKKEIAWKVNCLKCHNSGPRKIRPENSAELKIKDKVKLHILNLKILFYKQIKNDKYTQYINKASDDKLLKLNSCSSCHGVGGVRNQLSSINKETIGFLVKNKHMPPWPYKISAEDKKVIKKFILNN